MKMEEIKNALTDNSTLPSLFVLILILIVNAFVQPNFFSFRVFKLNMLTFTPLILVSIGQAIIILTACVDLSVGSLMSLITVIMASVMGDSISGAIVAVFIVFAISLLISSLNGFIISYMKLPSLVATFAMSAILFGIALTIRPTPGGYIPKFFYKAYKNDIFSIIPVPVLILAFALMVWFFLSKLRVTKYIYAVGGDSEAANASGINVPRTKLFAFMLSGFFVTLAGICLAAQTATGDARSGLGFTLNSVAAAVIGGVLLQGGRGNIIGAVFGGLIIGLLTNIIFFANISSFYQELAKGIIIIASLTLGLFFKLRSGKELI